MYLQEKGVPEDRWLNSITDSMYMNLSELWGTVKDREDPDVLQSMGSQRVRHSLMTEQQHTYTLSICLHLNI